MSNILNSNELVTISILQQIKIGLLEEKARLQRNGSALEESYIEDEPQKSDYVLDENVIEGTVTLAQLIDQQINAPTPIEALVQDAVKLDDETADGIITMPKKKKPSICAQFNAWLVARGAWRVRKEALEYEHERTKADVVNMCYGIDFAIKLINAEIERQKNGKAIQVEIPKVKEVSVL